MKLFFAYLKLHYKSVIMFIGFATVFAVVFILYDLPLKSVLYASSICTFLGLILLTVSFLRFRRKHKILTGLINSIADGVTPPPAANIIEEDYQRLLGELYNQKRRQESENAAAMTEMSDYYTLWAHQIKNPIAAMRLLIDDENGPLSEQLFRIEQYVDMVLTYIRTDSSPNDFLIRECDIDSIIRGALRKYAVIFVRKKLSLNYTPVNMHRVTDEKWMSFVIEQVLSNSLKYTREGGVSIYARDGRLVIEDTGIGISPEDLPRVCDKGYTGYNGRADKKSTGIGLYLCKRVLTRLSHTIEIQSENGTRVMIGFTESGKFE